MYFSRRIPRTLSPSPWALALDQARSSQILDLASSSPLQWGFGTDQNALLQYLRENTDWQNNHNHANIKQTAMELIARRCSSQGGQCNAQNIVLCASTSEAYAHLFRLLCDDGQRVLVPQPGYPLLEVLASLDGLQCIGYESKFMENGIWQVNWDALEKAATSAQILLVVAPNNPTGAWPSQEDWLRYADICRRNQVHLVIDLVFSDFLRCDNPLPPFAEMQKRITFFTLDGISKSAGLPHWKLGWIRVLGQGESLQNILQGLEWINDAYLSTSALVLAALPEILVQSKSYQMLLKKRLFENEKLLREFGQGRGWKISLSRGGWHSCMHFPLQDDEKMAMELLKKGLIIHPGYLYDFPEDGWLVFSLLGSPAQFYDGLQVLPSVLH